MARALDTLTTFSDIATSSRLICSFIPSNKLRLARFREVRLQKAMIQEIQTSSIKAFRVTVLGVEGIKPLHRFWFCYPELFVSLEKGEERFKTSISSRGKSVLWNETFKLAVKDDEPSTVRIALYRKKSDGSQSLLGHMNEQLDSLPEDTEIKRKFSSGLTINFKVSRAKITMRSKPERVFALIIGINEYKSDKHMDLRGCVNDAHAMRLFLSSLQVPESNICVLTDKDATREAILSSFRTHLIENTRIEKDDAIIFFYAGHGSRVDAPEEWETSDGKIETICPHDEWTRNGKKEEIVGIPSRTINTLFRTLAGKKGNNITAIFDSCHSGAIGRFTTRSGEELVSRCTPAGCPIKDPYLDDDVCGVGREGKIDIPEHFVFDSISSHVLLAACKHEEPAYETTGNKGETCGAFTNALITTLYSAPLDRMTYEDLIHCLPSLPRDQIPQCGGINIKRILFNELVPAAEEYKNSFPVKRRNPNGTTNGNGNDNGGGASGSGGIENDEYDVEAGLVHGVSVGTEFYIQATDYTGPLSSTYLGVLVAKTVQAHSSILIHRANDVPFQVPLRGARAIVSNWKNDASILKVFIHPKDKWLNGFMEPPKHDETMDEKLRKQCYSKVPTMEDAEVVIRYYPDEADHDEADHDEGVLEIERTDKIIGAHAERVIRAQLPKKELHRLPFILDGIAMFRYHLLRFSGDQEMIQGVEHVYTDGVEKVEMNLYQLGTPQLSIQGGYRQPRSPETNLLEKNRARIKSSEDERYGIKVVNYTRHSFFPYLFFFDPSDYSIQRWSYPYAPRANPPLHAFSGEPGKVVVGYGHGGGDPIQFITEDVPEDTGFMKLFVSDVYVDMGHIAQEAVVQAATKRKALKKADDKKIWGGSMAVITVHQ